MRTQLRNAIVGVRDAKWLDYRYFRHPIHDYRVFLIETSVLHRKRGIMVLRKDGARCELVDVVAPLEWIPLLVALARHQAARDNCDELFCWITAPYARHFEAADSERRDPDVSVPTSTWAAGPTPESVRGRWWLMSGDTDFH